MKKHQVYAGGIITNRGVIVEDTQQATKHPFPFLTYGVGVVVLATYLFLLHLAW
jgi:hypothetical protein